MRSSEETVAATEKNTERHQASNSPSKLPKPEPLGEVVIKKVRNFTCPACKVVLSEAVAINGKVTGWCGNTHVRISVPV